MTSNEVNRKLKKRLEQALVSNKGLVLKASEVRLINVKRMEREYDHYTEEDSPKGENVPGVRYRGLINLLSLRIVQVA